MNHLELFSGTHSFGKVSSKFGYEVYSLDIELGDTNDDYKSQHHFKEDILTWDYKQFPVGFFKIITASPVCTWWSHLRRTWIGRKIKEHNGLICTQELLDEDIEKFGIPMVDKIFEIIDYFDPEYYIIENPSTGKMKEYINDLIPYYDVDYCRYSDWGYKKTTRFWTNIEDLEFIPCDNKCYNIILINNQKIHKDRMGTSKTINDNGKIVRVNTAELRTKYKDYENINKNYSNGTTKLDRYRIPEKLIEKFFKKIYVNINGYI
jgi:hypothetical protein